MFANRCDEVISHSELHMALPLQEKQIKDEEKQLEDMKKKQVDELRRTLAQETADALSEQEKQLGLLIARLEVKIDLRCPI